MKGKWITYSAEELAWIEANAARLAMAEALANDGDGIPECIVAAVNAWPGIMRRLSWDGGVRRIILPIQEKTP